MDMDSRVTKSLIVVVLNSLDETVSWDVNNSMVISVAEASLMGFLKVVSVAGASVIDSLVVVTSVAGTSVVND